MFGADDQVGVAYAYCSSLRSPREASVDVLASLLDQLLQGKETLPGFVGSFYSGHMNNKSRPSFQELLDAVSSAISCYSRVFIIFDGLDDFGVDFPDRQRLLNGLFQLQKNRGINFLASLRTALETFLASNGLYQWNGITCFMDGALEDVRTYVNVHQEELGSSAELALRNSIQNAIGGV